MPLAADTFEPCPTEDQTDWGQKYQRTICADYIINDLNHPDFPCDENCCWKITYQTRWAGDDENEFEVQIYDVQYNGGDDCFNCIHIVLSILYHEIVSQESQADPTTFYNKLISTGRYPDDDYKSFIYIYIDAECYEDGILCDYEKRCCKKLMDVTFYEDPPNYQKGSFLDPEPRDFFPDCPQPECAPECDQYPVTKNPCDADCFYGDWEPEEYTETVTIPCGTTSCHVEYHYQIRTQHCTLVNDEHQIIPKEYKDYKINDFTTSPECDDCASYTMNDIYSFIEKDVLHDDEQHPKPEENGECYYDYRVLTDNCWKNEPGNQPHVIPCEEEGCCWSEYKICNENGEKVETKIGGKWYDECDANPDCFILCSGIVQKSSVFQDDFNIINRQNIETNAFTAPNPNTGTTELHFISSITGKIKIKIYNEMGIDVMKIEKEKKTPELIIPLKLEGISSGIYYFDIISHHKKVIDGSLIKIR